MAITLAGGDSTTGVDAEGRRVLIVAIHPESVGTGGGGSGDTTSGPLLVTAVGAPTDAAATTDAGTFSILAFIKRSMANWTSLLAKMPTLVNGAIATTTISGQVYGAGTGTVTIATANTSVSAAAAKAARRNFMLQNTSTADLWYAYGAAAVVGGGASFKLPAGLLYEPLPGMCTNQQINVVGATAGQTFSYQEC